MLETHLSEILKHLEEEYPKEGCGVIGKVNGETKWFPCRNQAEDPEEEFELNSKDYMEALLASEKIEAVVHSHPDYRPDPSDHDIRTCNFLNLPYYIISIPNKEVVKLNPGDRTTSDAERRLFTR
tara:strand:- start:3116 stop:3490 length:375 start_codon:yes stop_codon:yes gene_type:complete